MRGGILDVIVEVLVRDVVISIVLFNEYPLPDAPIRAVVVEVRFKSKSSDEVVSSVRGCRG